MKTKNFYMLIKASASSHKLSTGLFCFFVVISTALILMSVEMIFPLQSNIENKINNHVINRELTINFLSNTSQQDIDSDIEKINNIDNVTGVYLKPATLTAKDKSGELKGESTIDFLHNGYTPIITSGRAFEESETNVAIVPEIIKDLDSEKSRINEVEGKDLIGKTLELSYGTDNIYKVKVVGTYNTADPIFDGKQIVVPQKDLLKCNADVTSSYDGEAPIVDEISYLVSIDSYKNVEKAQEEISNIRMADKQQHLNIDSDSYNIALVLLFVVLAVFVVMVICGLFMFLQSCVKNRTNELALYRSLGYKSKHLFSIIFTEHLFFGVVSVALGVAVTAVLNVLVLNPYLDNLVGNTLMAMNANVSIVQIISVLLCFVVVLAFVCRQAVKRSEKIDLTILLRER